jgi:hypothetical protein
MSATEKSKKHKRDDNDNDNACDRLLSDIPHFNVKQLRSLQHAITDRLVELASSSSSSTATTTTNTSSSSSSSTNTSSVDIEEDDLLFNDDDEQGIVRWDGFLVHKLIDGFLYSGYDYNTMATTLNKPIDTIKNQWKHFVAFIHVKLELTRNITNRDDQLTPQSLYFNTFVTTTWDKHEIESLWDNKMKGLAISEIAKIVNRPVNDVQKKLNQISSSVCKKDGTKFCMATVSLLYASTNQSTNLQG